MKEKDVLEILGKVNAVITDSHIVYTSDKHGSVYVNKDAIYPYTEEIARLCEAIAKEFRNDRVEVVIAPAIGGVILSQWTAYHLTRTTGSLYQVVFGVYAERKESSLLKATEENLIVTIEGVGTVILEPGEELVKKRNSFEIKRGYAELVSGKNVLVVEDVLTTGGSAKKVIEATRFAGGNVIGLGVLCNRGGITPEDVGNPPKLFSLLNLKLDAWDEKDCPLCAENIPINIVVGKGKEYLARKKSEV